MSFYDALGKCTWCFNLEPEADTLDCFSPSDACESILRSLMVSASWSWEPVPPRLRLLETVAWSLEPSGNWAVEMEGTMDYSLYYASFHFLPSENMHAWAQHSLAFTSKNPFGRWFSFPQLFAFCSCSCFIPQVWCPTTFSGTSISTSCCRMLGFSIPLNLAFYVDFRG